MPVKLETTIKNIQLLDNPNNAQLIREFYLYMRSVNTSECYQNQNHKALINMAKFFGKNLEFIQSTFYFNEKSPFLSMNADIFELNPFIKVNNS